MLTVPMAQVPQGRTVRLAADAWVVTLRNLRRATRVPEIVVFTTIQPVMLVLLLSYVFGDAIKMPGASSYRELLMAGIFTQTLALTTATTAITMADDAHNGLIDRFRSLPMHRAALLTGRTLADWLQDAVILVLMSACGLVVGWRIHDGPAKAAAGYALMMLLAYAMSWVGVFIGLSVRTPDAAQSATFLWLYPLTFLSNAFVPIAALPPPLAQIAQWNPVSSTVLAGRLMFGNPTGYSPGHPPGAFPMEHPVLMSVASSLVILAVFIPLSIRKYKAVSAR
jgi:ABC transporter DrrB family efflux protein